MCGTPLGSLQRAIAAAAGSALTLALLWVVVAWLLGAQALWFPVLFGGLVSGAVVQLSAGRGWRYQAVATAATVVGIVFGDTLLLLLVTGRAEELVAVEQPNLRLLSLMRAQVESDPATLAFMALGVMGGFWVWRQPDGSE